MSLENLLILLAFAAVAFFQVVMPWLRKRRDGARPGEPDSGEPESDVTEEVQWEPVEVAQPATTHIRSTPSTQLTELHEPPLRARARLAPAIPPRVVRLPRRSLVGSLADVRHGMILRAVLGPCRAREPFDASSN